MQILKQSTAITLKIGPFLDDSDGVTAEEALTITAAEVLLSKNGGAFTLKTEATACTHDAGGWYGCPVDATDTGTLGRLQLSVQESGALPVWHEYMVVTANVWDSLFGADMLQADLTQIGGVAQSATDLKDFADAGYDPATNKVEGVKLVDTTTTNTDMVGTDNAATEAKQDIIDTVVDAIKTLLEHGTYGLSALETLVDEIESRLTATRAGYLDELAAANIPADVDTLKTYCDILDHASNGLANIKTLIDAHTAFVEGMNDLSGADVNAQVDTALADIHLDHLIQVASTVSDADPSSEDFDTALAEASNDHYNDMVILFTSGVLAGQARRISDYNGTSKNIKVSPLFTEAPGNGDAFVIVSGVYLVPNVDTAVELIQGPDAEDITQVISDLDGIKGDGWTTETLKAIKEYVDALEGDVDRALGLLHENTYLHTTAFDESDNMTSCKIDLYDSKAHAESHDGATGIVAKYTVTATYDADGLATYQVVRDS